VAVGRPGRLRLACGLAVLVGVVLPAPTGAAGDTRLIEAVKAANGQAIRLLLRDRIDVNAREADGTTALHWAVQADDLATVKQLIDARADVNASNRYAVTPLSVAATNGNEEMMAVLLAAGADVNAALLEGETVLMTAARTGNPAVLGLLLERGADANAREKGYGETALMWATAQNHATAVQRLVEGGADINARSAVMKFAKPRTPITVLPRGGWTPLMYAARQGSMEAARVLVAAGADLNVRDPDGTTALLLAIINSQYDFAAMLIEAGAAHDVSDETGMGPLYAAVDMHALPWGFGSPEPKRNEAKDSLDILKMLLARGADTNARLKRTTLQRLHTPGDPTLAAGATPFMRAAKSGDTTVMRLLLEHGADPLAVQENHTNALILAAGFGWRDGDNNLNTKDQGTQAEAIQAIKMCLELGLDIQSANDAGTTVLHGAAMRGDTEQIVRFLVQNGARVDAKNKQGKTALDVALERKGQDGADAVIPGTANLLRELLDATQAAVLR
jgi:ankyrin repeat protein